MPHRVMCNAKHVCYPQPNHVKEGVGICKVCARNDPVTAEIAFRKRVTELGATLLDPQWLGSNNPHRVKCAAGHISYPWPSSVQQGRGICKTCGNGSPEITYIRFKERLAELGAILIEPAWLGANNPHRVKCAAGHISEPRPKSVLYDGNGICHVCACMLWDTFYIVLTRRDGRVKFGVSSNGGKRRIKTHARAGYREVMRIVTQLPESRALKIEQAITAGLKSNGYLPVHGREYFGIHTLSAILDIADREIDHVF